jgi:hypothetical protein
MTAKAKTKRSATPASAVAPVAVAEAPPVVVTEAPPAGTNAMTVFDPAQLPAEVTEKVRKPGDLIDVSSMTAEQIAKSKKIFNDFDFSDTSAIIQFAAEPQKAMSRYLDILMQGISVKEAGVAGQMAAEISRGIDLMALDKVQSQIMNGTSKLGRVAQAIHLTTNYIHNFFVMKEQIERLTSQIEAKANNQMVTLDGESKKLDGYAKQAVLSVKELASWVVAAEAILIRERNKFFAQRDAVLKSKDPIAASELRDLSKSIARFEERALQVQIAYVKASSKTLPRVRTVQEGVVMEIQNISTQILFHLPEFKEGIVLVAALNRTKTARDDRELMNKNRRSLENVLNTTIGESEKMAIESQGDGLKEVQALVTSLNAIKTGIDNAVTYEAQSRANREEAYRLLVETKDLVSDAMKKAALQSARAA